MAKLDILTTSDQVAATFEKQMLQVLRELEKEVLGIVSSTQTARNVFDSAALLNSRPEMIKALQTSGYTEAVGEYVSTYKEVPLDVKVGLAGAGGAGGGLPPIRYTGADAQLFKTIAAADLEAFGLIGVRAMDELRLGLYRQAVSGAPFSQMVEAVRAATVGTSVTGSPLRNYAYTYANTAHLSFSGEVILQAGESIGAEHWEVIGPLDGVTRDVCTDALHEPIRTKQEWIDAGYWGGTPGGWNCRHYFVPVIEDD
jgi:hypothetical protein